MRKDPIRDLLATAMQHCIGLPIDHLAVPLAHVEARDGDMEAVRAWVEAHGGWMEKTPAPHGTGLRPDRFVIPASALMPARRAPAPT